MIKIGRLFSLLILFSVVISACKSDEVQPIKVEEPKPTADFNFQQVDDSDPFTFSFENNSKEFKEVRWEFGDDSSSLEISPEHTFLRTGIFRVKLRTQNGEGFWAQKEAVIEIIPEEILEMVATPAANSSLNLTMDSPYNIDSIFWYKGIGPGAEFISGDALTNISLGEGEFEDYTLRVKTVKGSEAEISRLLTDLGIVKDVTDAGRFTVLRDNGSAESNEGSLKLVDNNINTKFLLPSIDDGFWVKMEYFEPPVVNAYTFTSANDADSRDPKSWRIEGSNDELNWEILDTRTGEEFDSRFLTRTFVFENSKPYSFYRIFFTEVRSGGVFQMAEWRLLVLPQKK